MAARKGGLGRGLDAIFMDNDTDDKNNTLKLKISEIEPNRSQPRTEFNEEALAELADSIARHGVIQPLLVKPMIDGGYQIVAGERRWRAARMAGISEVPVVIRDLTDSEVMEIALIENLQREDLSIIEEALGYKTLMDKYGFTQEEVSKSVGKSRPAVTNALRLLNLPKNIIDLIKEDKISAGHARALLAFKSEKDMQEAAKLVIEKGISVRELEKLSKLSDKLGGKIKRKVARKTPFVLEVESSLKDYLGRKVNVSMKNNKKGRIEIEFYSQDDLQEIVKKLSKNDW